MSHLVQPAGCVRHAYSTAEPADCPLTVPPGDQVIEVNVSTDPKSTRDITGEEAQVVDFTYSAKWEETQIPFDRRMQKYSKYSFLPQHLEVRVRTPARPQAWRGPSMGLPPWRTSLVYMDCGRALQGSFNMLCCLPCRSTGSASSTAA